MLRRSKSRWARLASLAALAALAAACVRPGAWGERALASSDVVIERGTVVDGTGRPALPADVAIRDGVIAAVTPPGGLASVRAKRRIDARGLVVAPGFIDLLSMSGDDLLKGDGRMLNKLTQGVTTEVLGEGWSGAPSRKTAAFSGPHGFGAWLEAMERHHNATNVASFVGATTLRQYAMDNAPGEPTREQAEQMRQTLRDGMEDGALGLGSALIYPPGSFATTEELVDLAKVIAPYHGVYATHLRSEGDRVVEALDEALEIGRRGGVAVEIFHLKALGRRNWPKLPTLFEHIEAARAAGQDVTADTFPYTRSATMLSALVPPWASAHGKLLENLQDPAVSRRIHDELLHDEGAGWENFGALATPEEVVVTDVPKASPAARWTGRRLSEIAQELGTDWADAAIRLLIETGGHGSMLVTTMDEEGIALKLRKPWIFFGTDAGERRPGPERGNSHPRAMGTFPRVLGRYVREEGVLSLEEAVRRMSAAVADKLSIRDRGRLEVGMRADVAVFDPATISDRATEEQPFLPSTGMRYVLVNGVLVLDGGAYTGARPGEAVRGPGWKTRGGRP